MKRFITKILLFSIPFGIYMALMISIDPYNYFNISQLVDDSIKEKVSNKLNYRLWKMTKYKRNSLNNILLGDSRMLLMKTYIIKNQKGLDYYNFAYGGGSLEESIETFWFADSITDLSSVYIGINFHLFNGFHQVNEVAKIENYFNNPFLYLIDKVVIKAGFLCLLEQLGIYECNIEKPDMTKEEFWSYQINTSATGQFERYKYPVNNYKKLKNIAIYCDTNNIKLYFVIFPEHIDLINKYKELGFEEEFTKFKEDILALAPTFDYCIEGELTSTKENFTDPYHFSEKITLFLVDDIWKNQGLQLRQGE